MTTRNASRWGFEHFPMPGCWLEKAWTSKNGADLRHSKTRRDKRKRKRCAICRRGMDVGRCLWKRRTEITHRDFPRRGKQSLCYGAEFVRHFGIDAQHVLAFGDNENDMDMLRHAGVSVAMGNANREVQQVATMVTSSNKEGGVAAALQSLIF